MKGSNIVSQSFINEKYDYIFPKLKDIILKNSKIIRY